MVVSIHAFFGSTIYSALYHSYCYIQEGSYGVFTIVYSISFMYLLPTTLMIILGLRTVINVRQAQRRVRSTLGERYMQRNDRYLLRVLLFLVLVNVVFTIPLAIDQIEATSILSYWKMTMFSLGRYMDWCQKIRWEMLSRMDGILSSLHWFFYLYVDVEHIPRRTTANSRQDFCMKFKVCLQFEN